MFWSWIIALFFGAIAFAAVTASPRSFTLGRPSDIALRFLFAILALASLAFAGRETLRYRRFGSALLTLTPEAPAVGTMLGGYIELLSMPFRPGYPFMATLTCTRIERRHSGGKNSFERTTAWQDKRSAMVEAGIHGTRVRFAFALPANVPPSHDQGDVRFEWSLNVAASIPGADFDQTFDIAVAQSATRTQPTARAPMNDAASATIDFTGVVLRERGAELTLRSPYFRHGGPAFWLFTSGAVFGSVALGTTFASRAPALVPILSGSVATLLILIGVFVSANAIDVAASSAGLKVVRRVFGIRFAAFTRPEEIRTVSAYSGAQFQSGATPRRLYGVCAVTKDGKRMTLADALSGVSSAEELARRLRQALGIRDESDTSSR